MKKDIILSGVGGQGILSIATVIGEAAAETGVELKQAEVHGMSQRGGDVQSTLRLSNSHICSDLIRKGEADLIISMEPMEALRYVEYLAKDGQVITASKPFVNIPNYPKEEDVMAALKKLPHVEMLDIDAKARDIKAPKSANMILLGMAAPFIEIVSADSLRNAIKVVFAKRGDEVINTNINAFNIGYNATKK